MANTAASTIVTAFTDSLAWLRKTQKAGVSPSAYVVENQGFYICIEDGLPKAGGLRFAGAYSLEQANRIARTTRNGNGNKGKVLSYAKALANEIMATETLINTLTA